MVEASRDQILCNGTGIGLACMGPEWPFVCFTRGMNLKALAIRSLPCRYA